jgi:hypothetical protein
MKEKANQPVNDSNSNLTEDSGDEGVNQKKLDWSIVHKFAPG